MFRFKQFVVAQDACPMKVGTDGVLLGAWVQLPTIAAGRYLDIGTGTGLIALMLAQRNASAEIVALDVDAACATQVQTNALHSPWASRIKVVEQAVQSYCSDTPFDVIVSNPPYYDNSLLSPDAGRTTARHTVSLSFSELIAAANRLLAPKGCFAVILPIAEARRFRLVAASCFVLRRITEVHSTPSRGARRCLMEFVRPTNAPLALVSDTLIIATAPECYTEEYRQLTGDFYLKF
jgi:tRNA1Val (adenine37-N6)-methyltransferase